MRNVERQRNMAWRISISEKSQAVDSFYKDLLENV
jgi:hypothetical protein